MARPAEGVVAAPQRAVIPFTHTTPGLGKVCTPWSCFSRGFGVIFSHSYSTRCRMDASELFGCLIGRVDVKAKWGERKYQQPPWGHPAKPGGDSRARCELSRRVFVPATRGMKRISGLGFGRTLAFPPRLSGCILAPTAGTGGKCIPRRCGHPPWLYGHLGAARSWTQDRTVSAGYWEWNKSCDFFCLPSERISIECLIHKVFNGSLGVNWQSRNLSSSLRWPEMKTGKSRCTVWMETAKIVFQELPMHCIPPDQCSLPFQTQILISAWCWEITCARLVWVAH